MLCLFRHRAESPGAVKYVLQQWYSSTPVLDTEDNAESDNIADKESKNQEDMYTAAGATPEVRCDPSGSCRRYLGYEVGLERLFGAPSPGSGRGDL